MQKENSKLMLELQKIATAILEATKTYQKGQSKRERKAKGQFFSSHAIAQYMSSLIPPTDKAEICILDPGAGTGLLGVLAVTRVIASSAVKRIKLTFIENDPSVLPILYKVRDQLGLLNQYEDLDIQVTVLEENFILDTKSDSSFDVVICNPPYAKISKYAPEAAAMSEYVYGQPNIYALFVVKAIQMLSVDGSFVFITPRSWTSGGYFSKMREFVLQHSLSHIHLFTLRENVFSSEEVLQETMIWAGNVGNLQGELIISTSEKDDFKDVQSFTAVLQEIITGADRCLLLPSNAEDYTLLKSMNQFRETFESLGYLFKTGPVVEFRSKERISAQRKQNSVPMFRPLNVQDGHFVFPVASGKAQYVITDNEPSFNLQNTPTLIVKRMSSKEENRRLQCCIYFPLPGEPFISMENHVNYLARKDGKALSEAEVHWAYEIISSDQYERYCRMVSGSTQVNARDLNTLPISRRTL